MFESKLVWIGAASAVAIFFAWKFTSRTSYEAAEYQVVESEGAFEIRQYPELVVAATNMEFEAQGDDGSFMRLFRYISGDNEADQKIAMTVPVFMEPEGENAQGKMAFVLPQETARQGAPSPAATSVDVEKRAAGEYAVYRFSGRMDRQAMKTAEAKLRDWLSAKDLKIVDDLETAGYDPPWTPGPFRRNEVLLRVESK